MQALLPAISALPLIGAVVVTGAGRLGARGVAWLSGLFTAATLCLIAAVAGPVLGGRTEAVSLPWAPSIGLSLSFFVDGLSLLFLFLIAGIGLLIVIFARYYLAADEPLPRFYGSLMLFMASMLGVVSAGNLLLLVVFWELTSVSSFLLIGFWDREVAARKGAYQSLIVTGIGGLSLLAGVIVLGMAAGTFEWAELRARAAEVSALPSAPVALGLMLVGAFTKSAQWPFHFWLPSAMAAPTPVSAYLHSATMVKAGIFLIARLSPVFSGTELWLYAVTGFGAATMLVGGWGALRQTDLKALLAYSTISQLGMIVMTYGLGTKTAALAATLHILNHAAFKAPLFMTAGIVDHETGSRDLRRIGGLAAHLPRTALVAVVASAAMAGVPLLNGFVSKELFYEACLGSSAGGFRGTLLPFVAVAGSALTVAYSLRFVVGTFFGVPPVSARPPHEPPAGMRAPAELLVLACVAIGLFPQLVAGPLIGTAVQGVTGSDVHVHLAVWHGWTLAVGMSAVALALGIAYFVIRRSRMRALPAPRLGRTAGQFYDLSIDALLGGSRKLTDSLQTGSLHFYVRTVLAVVLLLGVASAWAHAGAPAPLLNAMTAPIRGAGAVTVLTVVASVAVTFLYRRRLPSVLALAAVGLLVAIYFVWLSAPDLVLTQLLVETVTSILVVLVLFFLPKENPTREPRNRLALDGLFALVVGVASAAVVYGILRRPFESISSYYVANSVEKAGGGNVVNVILVDFRGYDTLGEITVLGIAAVGVLALVRTARRAK